MIQCHSCFLFHVDLVHVGVLDDVEAAHQRERDEAEGDALQPGDPPHKLCPPADAGAAENG